jgi:hypothetical protein
LGRCDEARIAEVVALQDAEHFFGFTHERLHGLIGVRSRIGAMFPQDCLKTHFLGLGLLPVTHQDVLQRRMRRHLRHAQQRLRELLFDADQLLQFGKVHVFKGGDLHGDSPFLYWRCAWICWDEERANAAL